MIRLRKNRRVKSAATPNKKKRRKARKAKRNGSYSMAVVRKARKSLRRKSPSTRKRLRKAASTRAAKRRKAKGITPNKKRRTVKRRRSLKRNRAAAVVTPNKKRRRVKRRAKSRLTANKKRRTVKRRRSLKRNRLTTNRKRRSSRRLKSNRKRRTVRRNRSTRRRATPNRRRRSVRRNSRRRSLRRNSARRASPNRRRRSMRRNSRRRSMRRNGSQLMAFFKEAAVTGLLVAGGFFAHKVLTNLLEENLMRGLFEKKPEKTAAAGFGADAKKTELKDYSKLISGAVVAVAGVAATGYLVKDKAMALKLSAGMVASFIQQAVLTYLVESENAAGIQYLSGLDDGAAARLSSMAGDINRTTIQPFYTRLGEYFPHGTSGYGEYFQNPAMSGYGEYFQNPAMSGFGALEAAAGLGGGIYSAAAGYGADQLNDEQRKAINAAYVMSGKILYGSHPNMYQPPPSAPAVQGYGANPDIYQAVAGTRHHFIEGQHIDPTTSNLDRELSIMESMSGVGQVSSWNTELAPMQDGEGSAYRDGSLGGIYAASAGFGEFIEPGANGVQTVPTTQTWIPGEAEGELWAGVRNVDANMSTADVPAGIMQTIGGSGIFG